MFLEYLHVEDSFLTGFCAERCGFPRVRHPGFSSGRMETSEVKDSQILVHYMDEQRKRDMFERLSPLKQDEQEEENSEKEKKNANSACVCP